MHILIDTGHPAHILFYAPIARKLEALGYAVTFTIRDKEYSRRLAETLNLSFSVKGSGSSCLLLKPFYLYRSVRQIMEAGRSKKVSMLLSFASPYAGIAAFILRKPHIVFDDTEPDPLCQTLYRLFSTTIITPSCFQKSFGKKHIRVNAYKELAYLQANRALSNQTQKIEKPYIVVRLVHHGVLHDKYKRVWDREEKLAFVEKLARTYTVVISSEEALPATLLPHAYKGQPENFHALLSQAHLVVGESATVAAESAVLGVPAIYIDYQTRGYVEDIASNYGLIMRYTPESTNLPFIMNKINELMSEDNLQVYKTRAAQLHNEKEDIVAFVVDSVVTSLAG